MRRRVHVARGFCCALAVKCRQREREKREREREYKGFVHWQIVSSEMQVHSRWSAHIEAVFFVVGNRLWFNGVPGVHLVTRESARARARTMERARESYEKGSCPLRGLFISPPPPPARRQV